MESKRKRGRPKRAVAELGECPALTDAQWRGLHREIVSFRPVVLRVKRRLEYVPQAWPSKATLGEVANAAGVTKPAVAKWRKDDNYARGLTWLMSELLTKKQRRPLRSGQTNQKPERYVDKWQRFTDTNKRSGLILYLKKKWLGPINLPGDLRGDSQSFASVESWADYLIANNHIPDAWQPKRKLRRYPRVQPPRKP